MTRLSATLLVEAGLVSLALSAGLPAQVNAELGLGIYPVEAPVVVVQPDSRIIAATASSESAVALARYNLDGTLDASFGGDGIVRTDLDPYGTTPGVALQSDGKIVAAGLRTGSSVSVWRYSTDGSLDTTFGAGGFVQTDVDPSLAESAHHVAVQPDGRIVVAGQVGASVAILRYLDDGSLDPDFDGDGVVTAPGPSYMDGQRVALQPDGRIVVGCSRRYSDGFPPFPALFRYNADGSVDMTFDGDGIVESSEPYGFADVASQADGKIVALGLRGRLYRFTANGSPDPAFDGTALAGTYLSAYALAIQADGGILVAAGEDYPARFAVYRFLGDGSFDSSFADSGKFLLPSGSSAYATSVTVAGDGIIVAAGTIEYLSGAANSLAVARLNASGEAVDGFDGDGVVMESDCRRVPLTAPQCMDARGAKFSLRTRGEGEPSRFRWKWTGSEPGLEFAELGNPGLGTTVYTLCIYDSSGSQPTLVSWDTMGGGAWFLHPPSLWVSDRRYQNTSPHGQEKLKLSASGENGRPSAMLSVRDPYFGYFPTPRPISASAYFEQDAEVIVQLVSSDGVCMVSRFDAAGTSTNDANGFSAAER